MLLRVLLVDHADLEGRGAAEEILRPRDVLHAGKLHHDAVGALLLDHRLGDAELVDALVERADVLLERRFLDALLGFGPDGGVEARLRGVAGLEHLEVAEARRSARAAPSRASRRRGTAR